MDCAGNLKLIHHSQLKRSPVLIRECVLISCIQYVLVIYIKSPCHAYWPCIKLYRKILVLLLHALKMTRHIKYYINTLSRHSPAKIKTKSHACIHLYILKKVILAKIYNLWEEKQNKLISLTFLFAYAVRNVKLLSHNVCPKYLF